MDLWCQTSIKKSLIGLRLNKIGLNRKKLMQKKRGLRKNWRSRPPKRRLSRSSKRRRQRNASSKKTEQLPQPLLRQKQLKMKLKGQQLQQRLKSSQMNENGRGLNRKLLLKRDDKN